MQKKKKKACTRSQSILKQLSGGSGDKLCTYKGNIYVNNPL